MTKKDILSNARTHSRAPHHRTTQKHHVTIADLSPSADGSPVSDALKTHILFIVNSPSATVQNLNTLLFFFGPFLTQNGHRPTPVAMTPHNRNQQHFAVSSGLFYCYFSQRCSHALPTNPPSIHLVEYA